MTPDDIIAAVKAAKPGDTITVAGAIDHVFLRNLSWDAPGITLDCSAAKLANIRLQAVSGLTIKGGAFKPTDWLGAVYVSGSKRITVTGIETADEGQWPGVTIRESSDVSVLACRFDCPKAGVAAQHLQTGLIQGNTFYGYATDGVDLASCHDVTVELNGFMGGKLVDDHHPDAVQGWPIKGETPPSNIIVRDNVIHGHTQGVGFYNHDVGGYDGHVVERNDICISYPGAITLNGSRGSRVTGNRVRTLPGAPYKAKINTDAARSGNTVAAYLRWPADNDAS